MMQKQLKTVDTVGFKNTGRENSFKLKNMGTKIWITSTRITLTRQKSNQKVNIIQPNILYYSNWCHEIHRIHNLIEIIRHHKPVHFVWEPSKNNLLTEPVCHGMHMIKILRKHKPVHFPQNIYHATLLTEFSFPVTLHHHQMTHHFQQASHL